MILQKMYKKYINFNFKQKCSNVINIISLKYYAHKLFSIKVKQLLIKKKDYFDFRLVFNVKSTIPSYLIIEYYQEKSQILILIEMICKKKISNYKITTLKLFVLLFHKYQRLFFTFVDLAKVNYYYVFSFFALTILFFFNLKYYLGLVRYYTRLCMLLFTYKHIYIIYD